MSYTTPNIKNLIKQIQKHQSGVYIAYDEFMHKTIVLLANHNGITPEELASKAFKLGMNQLIDELELEVVNQ